MIVNAGCVASLIDLRTKIVRGLQRHMATIAILLSGIGIIKTARSVTRHTAQHERIVMVLASEKFVIVQGRWQVNLMTGGTEVGVFMEWF